MIGRFKAWTRSMGNPEQKPQTHRSLRGTRVMRVRRFLTLSIAILLQSGCGLFAQKVTFQTNPPNQEFQIDGTQHRAPVTLWLSRHSDHELNFRNFKGQDVALRLPTVEPPVPFPGRVFGTPVTINFAEEPKPTAEDAPARNETAESGADAGRAALPSNLPTFRGLRFGLDLAAQIPECPRTEYFYSSGGSTCWQQDTHCFNMPGRLPEESRRLAVQSHGCGHPREVTFRDDLGGTIGSAADVTLVDGKLVALYGRFSPPGKVIEAAEVFRAKYGEPQTAREEPWQSEGGVRTTAVVRLWQWNRLLIELRAPDQDINTGSVSVVHQDYADRLKDQRQEQLRKGVRDL